MISRFLSILFLVLALLALRPVAPAEAGLDFRGGDPSVWCRLMFLKIRISAREKKELLAAWWKQYREEILKTYGARFFLRDVTPAEAALERRWLGFWNEQRPGESAWYAHVYHRTRRLVDRGHTPPPPIPDQKKFAYEFFNGLDYIINTPVRLGSRALHHYGYLKGEKHLTFPMLMVGGYFALDYPLEALEEFNEETEKDHQRRIVVSDFRFDPLMRELREKRKELKELEAKGADPKVVEKARKNLDALLFLEVGKMEKLFEKYFVERAEYGLEWSKATDSRKAELEGERVVKLAANPLFSDLLAALGIKDAKELLKPEVFPVIADIFALRERLYLRYSLIPSIVQGGENLAKLEASPGYSEEVKEIQASPLYREMKALYEAKAIDAAAFQRLLMEESHWILERFSIWELLGNVPEKKDKEGKPIPGRPLKLADIHDEMRESLKKEKGLGEDYRRILSKK